MYGPTSLVATILIKVNISDDLFSQSVVLFVVAVFCRNY